MVCYDTVNTWLLFRNLENALHCICCLVFTQFKNKQRCKKNGQCLTLNVPNSTLVVKKVVIRLEHKCTRNVPKII